MKSNYMIWTARLLSLILLAGIMVLGILAYGYASDDSKIRVSKSNDNEFLLENADILSGDGWEAKKIDSLVIPEGNIYVYTSDIKEAETEFIMAGVEVTANVPSGTTVEGKVRASTNNQDWTEWIDMDLLGEDSVPQGKMFSENPVLFGEKMKFAQYVLTLSSEGDFMPEVYDVALTYIDSTKRYEFLTQGYNWLVDSVQGWEKVDIITRDEWEADESIMNWEPEYAPVEQIIVHHTAGGTNSPVDSAAVVRGIYYFHTVEKEWGDIGYNYLIDHHGRIFEGRKGGLGAVGAHASGNNYGSAGIAIIGDYTEDSPTQNALKSLIELTEYISYQSDMQLDESHYFNGNYIPVLAGHRDVNPTECPGDVLYSMLSDVRVAAGQGIDTLPAKVVSAQYVSQSKEEIDLKTGEIDTISIKFKNSGNAVWLKDKDDILVVPVDPYPRNSGLQTDTWLSSSKVDELIDISVMPGEEVVFDLELKGLDTNGRIVEKFALLGPDGILSETTFSVTINNTQQPVVKKEVTDEVIDSGPVKPVDKDMENALQNDGNKYSGQWAGQAENVSLYPGEEKVVWIDFKNIGETTWYRDGKNPVRLGTDREKDHFSSLYVEDAGWLAANRIGLQQWSVEPGEVGRFKFTIKSGVTEGVIREYFRPVVEEIKWLDDFGVYIEVTTKPATFGAAWVNQSESPLVMESGKKARVWVELENTGNVVWRNDGDTPVRLGTDRNLDRSSSFYSQGYWINENRAAGMKRSMVYPGDTVRFEIVLTAPENPGVYREYFRPVVDGVAWMNDLGIYWDIVVEK